MDTSKRTFKVRTLSNQTLSFQLSPQSKISDAKTLIFEKTAVPVDKQRLVLDSRLLGDDDTLGEYLKDNDSTIFLMSRLNEPQRDFSEGLGGKGETEQPVGLNRAVVERQPFVKSLVKAKFQNNPLSNQSATNTIGNQFTNTIRMQGQGKQYPPFGQPPMIPQGSQSQYPQPNMIPNFTSLIPFESGLLSFNELYTLSETINHLSPGLKLPNPPVPSFEDFNSSKRLGQYLAQWHFQMLRMLPYVYRLSELLQKEEYLNQLGRIQTQQQMFNVSSSLTAAMNASMPLIRECNRIGSSFGSYNYGGFGQPRGYNYQRQTNAPGYSQNDGNVDPSNYPYGYPYQQNSIPMRGAYPFWNGKPLKTSLPITAYSEVDHASVPIRQLVNSTSNSVWIKLFGDTTITELFYLFSGDDTSYLQNNRTKISSKFDQTTVSKISRDFTNVLLTQTLLASDPEGLPSYIYERIYPHVQLIVNITSQVGHEYSTHVIKQFRAALGQILYQLVEATSSNVDSVADSILNSLRKSFGDYFPHGETYFSLLSSKFKQGMKKAYGEYQKKMEDQRNRLII